MQVEVNRYDGQEEEEKPIGNFTIKGMSSRLLNVLKREGDLVESLVLDPKSLKIFKNSSMLSDNHLQARLQFLPLFFDVDWFQNNLVNHSKCDCNFGEGCYKCQIIFSLKIENVPQETRVFSSLLTQKHQPFIYFCKSNISQAKSNSQPNPKTIQENNVKKEMNFETQKPDNETQKQDKKLDEIKQQKHEQKLESKKEKAQKMEQDKEKEKEMRNKTRSRDDIMILLLGKSQSLWFEIAARKAHKDHNTAAMPFRVAYRHQTDIVVDQKFNEYTTVGERESLVKSCPYKVFELDNTKNLKPMTVDLMQRCVACSACSTAIKTIQNNVFTRNQKENQKEKEKQNEKEKEKEKEKNNEQNINKNEKQNEKDNDNKNGKDNKKNNDYENGNLWKELITRTTLKNRFTYVIKSEGTYTPIQALQLSCQVVKNRCQTLLDCLDNNLN